MADVIDIKDTDEPEQVKQEETDHKPKKRKKKLRKVLKKKYRDDPAVTNDEGDFELGKMKLVKRTSEKKTRAKQKQLPDDMEQPYDYKYDKSKHERSMNTENSQVNLNDISDFKSANSKLEIGNFNQSAVKSRIRSPLGVKVGDKNSQSEDTKDIPIFKSLCDSNVFVDLVRNGHPYFTRYIRYTLIFLDIFLCMLQIACLLEICYGPLTTIEPSSVVIYAFEKVWISILTSLGTQGIIYGTITLLRWNEHDFMNVRNHQNYAGMNKDLKEIKKVRFTIFFICFFLAFIVLYVYYIVGMTHSNEIGGAWMILTIISAILDFVVVDFLLIMIQLWFHGISASMESKIRNIRLVRIAKDEFAY